MRKRLVSILLLLSLVLSLLPVQALAYVGTLQTQSGDAVRAGKQAGKYYGFDAYYLENDYIRFDLVDAYYLFSVTQPTRTAQDVEELLITENYRVESTFSAQYRGGREQDLFISSHTVRATTDSIVVDYRFTDENIGVTVTYTLVQLNQGFTGDHTSQSYTEGDITYTYPDDNDEDTGRTWGVSAVADCFLTEKARNQAPGDYLGVGVYWTSDYNRFDHTGHPSANEPARILLSRTEEYGINDVTYTTASTDVSAGLGWTSTRRDYGGRPNHISTITELYSDSYFWANPFFLTGNDGGGDFYHESYAMASDGWAQYGGVRGFGQRSLPESVSYTRSDGLLRAKSREAWLWSEQDGDAHASVAMVWGFRDLYKANETEFTPTDDITLSDDATSLGVYRSDKYESGYAAYALPSEAEAQRLQQLHGEPVATFRGSFVHEQGGGMDAYVFRDGKAALSATVTATWDEEAGGRFRVGADGTMEYNQLNLNTPNAKFYAYQDEDVKLRYGDAGLVAGMNPKKNGAIISIDIPNVSCLVDEAVIQNNGDLLFSGAMSLNLLFGPGNLLTVEKLSYGMQNGQFKCNGVKASGEIDTAEMIGLELAKIAGEINTFKGEELYHFELELDAFELFQTEAELTLKRLNSTGDLMPDDLWFFFGAEPGIQLVPPFIAGRLTGGGGGFYDLADTCNGDFFAIPPIRLRLAAMGSYLNILDGRAEATVGPSYAQWKVKDVKIMKLGDLIDEYETHIGLNGEKRTISGKEYSGLNLGGGMSISINVPQEFKIIQAGGSFDLNAFGGLDNWSKPTSVYLQMGANGMIFGKARIPSNVPIIGGWTLASASAEFALGGSTVVPVRNTDFQGAVQQAFKNFHVYGGATTTGSLAGVKYRIYYIIPKTVGVQTAWFGRSLPEWSFDNFITKDGEMLLLDENGEQIGIAAVDLGIVPLETATEQSGETTQEVSLNQTLPAGGELLLMVTPQDQSVDMDAFCAGLRVDGLNLIPLAYNESGEITNADAANLSVTTNASGKQCVLVHLGGDDAATTWTVHAASAFDASLNYSEPLPALQASLSGATLTGSVQNPAEKTSYLLRTYYGTEPGGTDYLLGETPLAGGSASVALETSGTIAPTGSYYVTTYLMEEVVDDFDGDGVIAEDEVAALTVDSAQLGQISYTNTLQPAAPANVRLEAMGNEVLQAGWDEVADADGYRVTIYRKDGDSWVETEAGYAYDRGEFDTVQGLGREKGRCQLNMALTMGGSDSEGNSMTLDANETYRVGVEAYRYLTDASGGKTTGRISSAQTKSDGVYLAEYVPLELGVELSTEPDAYRPLTADPDTGMFSGVLGQSGWAGIRVSAANAETAEIAYTITRADTGAQLEYDSVREHFELPEETFEGTLTLKIEATNQDTRDTTTKYLQLDRDNTAPLLTVDSASILADRETGAYEITGSAEPGSIISMRDGDATAAADSEGRFKLTAKLDRSEEYDPETETYVPGELQALLTELTARDAAQNSSNAVPVVIAPEMTEQALPLPKEFTLHFETNGGSALPDLTKPAGTVIDLSGYEPVKAGERFGGWYADPALTAAVTTVTLTQNTTVYAAWRDPCAAFTDIDRDAWYHDSVDYVIRNGLMNGMSASRFAPQESLTRAQLVTILYRMRGAPEISGKAPFRDVRSGSWYEKAVIWAAETGVVAGYPDGTFRPDQPITREQIAVIFYRCAGASPVSRDCLSAFPDSGQISAYARDAMNWAVYIVLINGVRDTSTGIVSLNPQDTATRAQIAAIIQRYRKHLG